MYLRCNKGLRIPLKRYTLIRYKDAEKFENNDILTIGIHPKSVPYSSPVPLSSSDRTFTISDLFNAMEKEHTGFHYNHNTYYGYRKMNE